MIFQTFSHKHLSYVLLFLTNIRSYDHTVFMFSYNLIFFPSLIYAVFHGMDVSYFSHSLFEGHPNCFLFFVMTNVGMNILAQLYP